MDLLFKGTSVIRVTVNGQEVVLVPNAIVSIDTPDDYISALTAQGLLINPDSDAGVPGAQNRPVTPLVGNTWNFAVDGQWKTLTLVANKTISITSYSSAEANLLIDGDGHTLTVGGVAIVTSASPAKTLVTFKDFDGDIVVNKPSGISLIPAIRGYYILGTDNSVPDEAFVLANGTPFSIVQGQDYSLLFPNASDKFWKVFEPSTQPAKTHNHTPYGDIAFGSGGLFGTGVTVGSFRGYIVNYATQSPSAEVNFNQ